MLSPMNPLKHLHTDLPRMIVGIYYHVLNSITESFFRQDHASMNGFDISPHPPASCMRIVPESVDIILETTVAPRQTYIVDLITSPLHNSDKALGESQVSRDFPLTHTHQRQRNVTRPKSPDILDFLEGTDWLRRGLNLEIIDHYGSDTSSLSPESGDDDSVSTESSSADIPAFSSADEGFYFNEATHYKFSDVASVREAATRTTFISRSNAGHMASDTEWAQGSRRSIDNVGNSQESQQGLKEISPREYTGPVIASRPERSVSLQAKELVRTVSRFVKRQSKRLHMATERQSRR